ncbi:hypothetical protein HPB50_027042 [Hyalomma asiaticum]|uniref:Uncharacterized protein n=1 Tax=Hyalomma asiaticum TaxID=266040 RepID=A0ACB7RT43_HYAAI|nr:hypothetical protein HPB50_027042 [Hyalomma asiaticum]
MGRDVSARGNANRNEAANEAARDFTYRAAEPADSTEEAQDYAPASPGPEPKRGGDVPATTDWVAAYAESEGGKDNDPSMACGRRGKRPTGRRAVQWAALEKQRPSEIARFPIPQHRGRRQKKGGSSEGCSPSRGHHAEVAAMTPPFVG